MISSFIKKDLSTTYINEFRVQTTELKITMTIIRDGCICMKLVKSAFWRNVAPAVTIRGHVRDAWLFPPKATHLKSFTAADGKPILPRLTRNTLLDSRIPVQGRTMLLQLPTSS